MAFRFPTPDRAEHSEVLIPRACAFTSLADPHPNLSGQVFHKGQSWFVRYCDDAVPLPVSSWINAGCFAWQPCFSRRGSDLIGSLLRRCALHLQILSVHSRHNPTSFSLEGGRCRRPSNHAAVPAYARLAFITPVAQ